MTDDQLKPKNLGACIECGAAGPIITGINGEQTIRDGDVSICRYCRHLAIFTSPDGDLREPTQIELIEIATDPEIKRSCDAIAQTQFEVEHPALDPDTLSVIEDFMKGTNRK